MHGRRRKTIDPGIPTYTGADHIGFSPARQTLLVLSTKRGRRRGAGGGRGRDLSSMVVMYCPKIVEQDGRCVVLHAGRGAPSASVYRYKPISSDVLRCSWHR